MPFLLYNYLAKQVDFIIENLLTRADNKIVSANINIYALI